jgi:hypothetical protein
MRKGCLFNRKKRSHFISAGTDYTYRAKSSSSVGAENLKRRIRICAGNVLKETYPSTLGRH